MAGKRGNPNFNKNKIENKDENNEIVETKTTIIEDIKEETEVVVEANTKVETKKIVEKPITAWKPELTRMICLKNISRGKLIYKSKRQMGYAIEWDKTGDKNYIELSEFMSLKNSDRRFITEPWIRILEDDEIEILKYANILQYYEGLLGLNNTEDILLLDFTSFKKKFDKLPLGYKKTLAEQAAKMIKNGQLDSIKIKNYIEEQLEVELEFLGRE